MEESTSAHACKINYDDFNNMSQRDAVKFRRSYGSVKLNPREGEEAGTVDEFGIIIDKIQEVNEDVFLTRECNNFDLINLDSSQHSLSSAKCIYIHSNLHEHSNRDTNNIDSSHDDLNEIFDEDTNRNTIKNRRYMFNRGEAPDRFNTNSEEDSLSHSSIEDRKSDSFTEVFSEPTLSLIYSNQDNSCNQQVKHNSSTPNTGRDYRDVKSVRFRDNGDILTSMNLIQNSSSSNDEKNGKCDPTEEMDSDESSKWDKKINDTTYNAQCFYNSENHKNDQIPPLHEDGPTKSDLSEEESAPLIACQQIVTNSKISTEPITSDRDAFLNDAFDNESVDSQDTSLSASSTFESAMSSNDMMSPFGTPRNSLSKQSSLGGATSANKKMGINFASLTSENIPNTLNRISMHKAVEKSILKIPSSNIDSDIEKMDRGSNQNILTYNKVHSSHSIRKLLCLTSQKKGMDKASSKKDNPNEVQFCRKEISKTISLKNRDKKINLREFYSSRRNKLKRLVETEMLIHRAVTNSPNEIDNKNESSAHHISIRPSKSVPARTCKKNQGCEVDEKYGFKEESKNVITEMSPRSRENKTKFVSKIPRPVSRKELCQKQSSSNFHRFDIGLEKKHLNNTSFIIPGNNTAKSDKSETLSRPSDGSEYSYKEFCAITKTKEGKIDHKNSSKMLVNVAQINSLRSKYWMKESKISFSSVGSTLAKKEDTKIELHDKERKKVKSNAYLAPQPARQTSRLAYGKMVRVKTAPIKSAIQIREKSIVRESSRPDTAYSQLKLERKPSKVVSIGAMDVNKIL